MLRRFGYVVWWSSVAVSVLFLAFVSYVATISDRGIEIQVWIAIGVLVLIILAVGRGSKYIFSGE